MDSLYQLMPPFMQNIALSMYGLQLKVRRYGGIYPGYKKELDEYMASMGDVNIVKAFQASKIRELVSYAKKNVPYYSECYRLLPNECEITLDNFSSVVPILDKSTLKSRSSEFRSKEKCKDIVTINTSGSTGSPLSIACTRSALQKNYAHFEYFLNSNGVNSFDRSATFAGRKILSSDSGAPFCRKNFTMNTLLCSSYHLSEKNVASYINELNDWAPIYIDSYPSAVYELACLAKVKGLVLNNKPKCIVTSSETLFSYQRREIEDFFECKVYDQYGQAEMGGTLAQYNSESLYTANPFYGLVEVLDEEGRQVMPGESGALVLTGFINSYMPLIRYKIGDNVTVANSEDAFVGSHALKISEIVGREDDVVLTPEGKRIGRLDPAFKGVVGIGGCQIVQHALDKIELRIVPQGESADNGVAELIQNLKERLGESITFQVTKVQELEKTKSGKVKGVISKL
ncbi:phenylacetate--CoA ligase family protein [Hahella sp. HN01]|uniref:phenylacetate--CoA ligase family protein n=1 Tax=Hahella sp. HN01 TaxID=2847262 RepID=UPI0035302103